MVFNFFGKESSAGAMFNKELVEEIHKPIIKIFEKRKIHPSFTDTIWGTDLADMQLISKFNNTFRFLLCIIAIYSKCAGVICIKDKKFLTLFKNIYMNQNANQIKYG